MTAEIGRPAPPFELRNVDGEMVSLDDLKGHKSLVVFIPFPFTGNCDAETCAIRDGLGELDSVNARVVIITTDTVFTNREWSKQHGFSFPVLSDFWPHGTVTASYGTFDDRVGAAYRSTYVLDEQGIVRAVVATDSRKIVREFDAYVEALAAI
jgi:mycoredoxin-dependent peroxiredoxin